MIQPTDEDEFEERISNASRFAVNKIMKSLQLNRIETAHRFGLDDLGVNLAMIKMLVGLGVAGLCETFQASASQEEALRNQINEVLIGWYEHVDDSGCED